MILEQETAEKIPCWTETTLQKPVLIGEGLHVLDPAIEKAVRNQDASLLLNRVDKEIRAGAEALTINLGPGRAMAQSTPWVVETIAGEVDVPLFLSSGVASMSNVLEQYGSRITINAVTANSEFLAKHLRVCKHYGTRLVVLLVKPGLMPTGTDDRVQLAAEVISQAMDIGLPLRQLYLDPVFACRPDPVAMKMSRGLPDIGSVLETIDNIRELDTNVKTIVALGNGTIGLSRETRSALHCRLLPLLTCAGLDAVILNCLDRSLMQSAKQIKDEMNRPGNSKSAHILQ